MVDFMLALRRFAASRGLPSVFYSDNPKTFAGTQDLLVNYFGPISPQWKFTVPRSPWWGGWWERLVRSVKSALKKSLGGHCLTRSELETTLHEVEACINSRPLTFVGDELDSSSPLTPSHFLIGRSGGFQVFPVSETETVSGSLSDREVFRQQKLNYFWSKWSNDYLRNLPPTVPQFQGKGKAEVGAVVLIREDNTPRLKWPLGVITQVFPGRDGIVRSVQVKTAKGTLTRPIQRLHDLEIANNDHVGVDQGNDQHVGVDQGNGVPVDVDQGIHELETQPVKVTRSGRFSKPVHRLDL